MLKNKDLLHIKNGAVLLFVIIFCWAAAVWAGQPGWQRQEVDWRMTGGARIKAVDYPEDKSPPMLAERSEQSKQLRKEVRYPPDGSPGRTTS